MQQTTFAETIKRFRPAVLREATNRTATTVSNWYHSRTLPDIVDLPEIADAIGMPLDHLCRIVATDARRAKDHIR